MNDGTASFDVDAWQSGSTKCASFDLSNTCFEDYWSKLPHLSDGMHVDCFTFLGRMALLKYLLFDMDPATLWQRGDTHLQQQQQQQHQNCRETHWLWGYACQMDWQHRSGRFRIGLRDAPSATDDRDRISDKSWWSYMNFCFSVCIFVGAQRAGLATQLNITFDAISEGLIANDAVVQRCIDAWEQLFRNGYLQYKNSIIGTNISDGEFSKRSFLYHHKVWATHTAVIQRSVGMDPNHHANPVMADLLSLLPEPERNFGLGWCRMVDILAACCFPTDLRTLKVDGAGFLPIQVVSDEAFSKFQKNRSALTKIEQMRYASVASTHRLIHSPEIALYLVALFWKRVVRTDSVRRSMPGLLNTLTHGKSTQKAYPLLRILSLFAWPRGVAEWSLGCALLGVGIVFYFR
jgi:hypothetical protein